MIGEKDLNSNSQSFKAVDTPLNNDEQILNDNHSGSITSPTKSWEPILEKSINAIVSIKANRVRSFDTERAG